MESARLRRFLNYLKADAEWAQRTSEISDTSQASVKIPYKVLSMLQFVYIAQP